MKKVGERLKDIRTERGLTLKDVSEGTGYSFAAIAHWERGIRTPNSDAIIALCDFFEITADYLLGRTDIL